LARCGPTSIQVAEAKIQRTQSDIDKSITVDRIKNEVNQNYQNYTAALNKIKLLQTAIAQAGENNKILESKYRSNIASAVERADSQTCFTRHRSTWSWLKPMRALHTTPY
jgi:outer membrane protein